MLVVTRRKGERILIGDDIVVTVLDVRGDGYPLVDAVRPAVMRAQPRGDFDRWFLDAMRREASRRPTCQSARLVNDVDLAGWMARSPWSSSDR